MSSNYTRVLGNTLRQIRLYQNKTLREVAEPKHVSFNYLSNIENGNREVSSQVLEAVCDSLDIELWWLLKEVSTQLKENK